jgi:hypothetical protein
MRDLCGKIFLVLACAGLIVPLFAHPLVNGTWVLNPTRSNFAGEPAIQTGTVTINERQHHIYISRSFNYDNEAGGFDYSFTTDGAVNSTIKNGKSFRSKAKWEHDSLVVTTTREGLTTVERYNPNPDGTLTLVVERPNHQTETLYMQRQ